MRLVTFYVLYMLVLERQV